MLSICGRNMIFPDSCRKIVAVGRNFAAHAKELGNAVPKAPILFLKPPTSILQQGKGPIEIPPGVDELHHEIELGVVIGQPGRDIPVNKVSSFIAGYVCALDMTARSLQNEAKKQGLPWSVAKGYDTFTPISALLPKSAIADTQNLELWCEVHGQTWLVDLPLTTSDHRLTGSHVSAATRTRCCSQCLP